MNVPDFIEEQLLWENGYDLVIGIDEVGRGCFAGPIVAAACAFPTSATPHDSIRIDDSKRLKPNERKRAALWIKENCLAYGIGEVNVATINKIGIGKATAIAMRKAIVEILRDYDIKILSARNKSPNILVSQYPNIFILIDAFYVPYVKGIPKIRQRAIIKGDQKSISIAAASIIAKVYRDALMQELDKKHTIYGWGSNKGYGTRDHQEAIIKNGITKLHRVAFVETFLTSQRISL